MNRVINYAIATFGIFALVSCARTKNLSLGGDQILLCNDANKFNAQQGQLILHTDKK